MSDHGGTREKPASTRQRVVVGVIVAVLGIAALSQITGFLSGIGSEGNESLSAVDLEVAIIDDLSEQGVRTTELDCAEPGDAVAAGDRTVCRGEARNGTPLLIEVTFNSDGSYVWKTQ